ALLERVLVALVDDEREVVLLDPAAVGAHAQACFGVGNLLDADRDAHGRGPPGGRRGRLSPRPPPLHGRGARPWRLCYLLAPMFGPFVATSFSTLAQIPAAGAADRQGIFELFLQS